MNRQQDLDLVPLDLEIERTFRARRREQQGLAALEDMAEGATNNGNNGHNVVIMADDWDREIREYAVPVLHGLNSSVVRPKIQAPQFELKPVTF